MRRIDQSTQFRRDYRRVLKAPQGATLGASFVAILENLVSDRPLEARYRDHALIGEWRGFRDCHVRPDLVLIYRKVGIDVLELRRLGSHSELRL